MSWLGQIIVEFFTALGCGAFLLIVWLLVMLWLAERREQRQEQDEVDWGDPE